MNLIGIIPARAGSKRVVDKNIRHLGNQPLLAWTVEAARAAGCFQRLLVSTDSARIAALAQDLGAEVPWLRPAALATDTAPVADVVIEILDRIGQEEGTQPDAVMLLQPTSPFRRASTILQAVNLYREHAPDSVVSVSPARPHPQWCKHVGADGVLSDYGQAGSYSRSQDLPAVYALNGAIYLAAISVIRQERGFYSKNTRALVIDDECESLDIDTPYDWMVAECIAARKSGGA